MENQGNPVVVTENAMIALGYPEGDACQIRKSIERANPLPPPNPAEAIDWHQLTPAQRYIAYMGPSAETLSDETLRRIERGDV